MTKTEQARREQATADFLIKMDRLEAEVLAEIATLVRDAKARIVANEFHLLIDNEAPRK